jgi:hypothetical protein
MAAPTLSQRPAMNRSVQPVPDHRDIDRYARILTPPTPFERQQIDRILRLAGYPPAALRPPVDVPPCR